MNLVAFGIPLFLLLMAIEWYILRLQKKDTIRLDDAIANISVGIAERLCDVLITGYFYWVYAALHNKWAFFNIQPGIINWLALLIATDFVWYWYHRLGHEINLLWALHIVHHQSNDYNFTVSARITIFQAIARTGFWSILPIIGFPPGMIITILLIHGTYPFFLHTKTIGKLGILEYILVTPSHHRVHHASNPEYLDKNYGDVLIIWDKLFGTFKKEGTEPVYGLTHPLNSYSFLWQHFHYFIEMWIVMKQQPSLQKKLKVLFDRPENLNQRARLVGEKIFGIRSNSSIITEQLNRYVIWQMALLLAGLFVFVLLEKHTNGIQSLAFSTVTLLTLINCGAIMEQKQWIYYLELIRFTVVALSIACCWLPVVTSLILLIGLLMILILISEWTSLPNKYLQLVYPNIPLNIQ